MLLIDASWCKRFGFGRPRNDARFSKASTTAVARCHDRLVLTQSHANLWGYGDQLHHQETTPKRRFRNAASTSALWTPQTVNDARWSNMGMKGADAVIRINSEVMCGTTTNLGAHSTGASNSSAHAQGRDQHMPHVFAACLIVPSGQCRRLI